MSPMPFWPSLRAVDEADAGAGQDQQPANPQRRRLVAFGLLVERADSDERLQHDQQQERGQLKPTAAKTASA